MTVAPEPRTDELPATDAYDPEPRTPGPAGGPSAGAAGSTGAEPAAVPTGGEAAAGGRHRRAPEERASYREVFAISEFRALWVAQVLSYAGDQFAQVAIAILVYHRTGSPFLTALTYALTYLPPIAGGPLLSSLADLFPRRRVMIVCDLLRVATVGFMALPATPFAALCALLFLTVLIGTPFSSARAALLPDVLPGDKYVLGSAISSITFQASQIAGFVAGAGVVAILDAHRTLAVDAMSFCLSALIILLGTKARPSPRREGDTKRSLWAISKDGVRIVFGNPVLRTLLLFGWLAGFVIVPEGLAAPYAHSLHGTTLTVGLLMAAMPTGAVIGAYLFGKLCRPSTRIRIMGWMAMLSCAPLIASAWNPPLSVILPMWALAGAGGAYQLAAAAAFVQALTPETRARAFGLAQSGLYAVQGIGILAGGAIAQAIGPTLAVGLAGLTGLTAATMLAMAWIGLRGRAVAAQRPATPGPATPA
ncbi:MAG TPA: MFS transporter [Streptosporangiaceae bacterium]|nr:MFS transporter [Streptosporangiaceae bacterium]